MFTIETRNSFGATQPAPMMAGAHGQPISPQDVFAGSSHALQVKSERTGFLSGFFRRLVRAREAEARRVVNRMLLQQSDEHLKAALGLSDEEIQKLRRNWRT